MQIKKVSEISPVLKIMVYGEPGSGKTTFVSSFAKFWNVLLITADPGGYNSILGKDVSIAEVTSVDDVVDLIDEVRKEINKGDSALSPFDVIALDSYTGIANAGMLHLHAHAKTKRNVGGLQVPELQWYAAVASLVNTLVLELANLKKHVIITTHVMAEYNNEGSVVGKKPWARGREGENLPYALDELWYAYSGYNRAMKAHGYWITTEPGLWITKSRISSWCKLPSVFPNDIENVVEAINKAGIKLMGL